MNRATWYKEIERGMLLPPIHKCVVRTELTELTELCACLTPNKCVPMVTAAPTPLLRAASVLRTGRAGRHRCPEQFKVLNFTIHMKYMIEERR